MSKLKSQIETKPLATKIFERGLVSLVKGGFLEAKLLATVAAGRSLAS